MLHHMETVNLAVFPAYAGVNPAAADIAARMASIPRVCGGEPFYTSGSLVSDLYSPRMRG